MSLTDDEKEMLAKGALFMATAKLRCLSEVSRQLYSAMETVRSYQSFWTSYAQDPQMEEIYERIGEVMNTFSPVNYNHEILTALGVNTHKDLPQRPEEEQALRLKEAGIEWEDDHFPDIPFVDPLEMFKRYKK